RHPGRGGRAGVRGPRLGTGLRLDRPPRPGPLHPQLRRPGQRRRLGPAAARRTAAGPRGQGGRARLLPARRGDRALPGGGGGGRGGRRPGGGRPGRAADLRRHTGAGPLSPGRGGGLGRRAVIRGGSGGGWGGPGGGGRGGGRGRWGWWVRRWDGWDGWDQGGRWRSPGRGRRRPASSRGGREAPPPPRGRPSAAGRREPTATGG